MSDVKIYEVTNIETSIQKSNRYIVYRLEKELPTNWDKLSTDKQGYWLNENAIFVKDTIEEADTEMMDEVTVQIKERA